ncbi:MAG TPA: hypothetical protein VFW96_03350 [Thermomicrobiales bacterium]|nr:hypothetical protein [Thermomicrobiales bacterium]
MDQGPREARDIGELLASLERRAYAVQREVRRALDATPEGHPAHALLEQASVIAGAYWRGVLAAYEAVEVARRAPGGPPAREPQAPASPEAQPGPSAAHAQARRELERNLWELRTWEAHHGIAPPEGER